MVTWAGWIVMDVVAILAVELRMPSQSHLPTLRISNMPLVKSYQAECSICYKRLAKHNSRDAARHDLLRHLYYREGGHREKWKQLKGKETDNFADFIKVHFQPEPIPDDRRTFILTCPNGGLCSKSTLGTCQCCY